MYQLLLHLDMDSGGVADFRWSFDTLQKAKRERSRLQEALAAEDAILALTDCEGGREAWIPKAHIIAAVFDITPDT